MNCIRNNIFVTWNPEERFTVLFGDKSIIIPFKWQHLDEYGFATDKMEENINYLQTAQQTAYVLAENPKFKFKKGDKVIFHYLAISYKCTVDGIDGAFIDATDIFFRDNGEIDMADGYYLCEQLFDDIPQTPSGIFLEHIERKKECHLKVLHGSGLYQPGDIVFSIDGAQYKFTYEGKEYIKLKEEEIVGALV